MNGIAELLLIEGFQISGSDLVQNDSIDRLKKLGAEIHIGHKAEHVQGAEVIVYTSAVNEEHVEIRAGLDNGIPVIRRAEMLSELMRLKAGVCISGTHGKTTVTSLIGEILIKAGLDPTVLVGGRLKHAGTGARQGLGQFIIAEADEFDRSFLKLAPLVVVITNIDSDHIECYGSYEELVNAFTQFANSVPFYGKVILCSDNDKLMGIVSDITRPVVSYGIDSTADVTAEHISYSRGKSNFMIHVNSDKVGEIHLPLPGRHNVLNSLAAATVGLELGVGFDDIKSGLEGFKGVHRRFEIIGETDGIIVADDFAHHPAEVAATLDAARSGWGKSVIAVFQPHLFSRTKELAVEFGRSLMNAETVFVLPIYPAREEPIEGVTSGLITESARAAGHKNIHLLNNKNDAIERVLAEVEEGDMVLTLGAGDVNLLSNKIYETLSAEVQ